MIVGCFRGCFSFNAETAFEKARLQATYSGDYEPPAESDIQQILLTLAGNDPETRPDVAFQLIQSKMQYSESKNQWNYLVKNLILLDRCVEDRSFVNDIATIHILHVENYKDPDPKNNIIKIDGFIRKYFQFIKMKSRLYGKKNSSFNVSKSEKRKYFQSLTTDKIFFEMNEAIALFSFIIELVRTNTDPLKRISKRGYLEYKLNQYVFHLMLYTMMNLYTTIFTVIAVLLERLTDTDLDDAQKIKQYYMQFLKYNELFSQFVEDHKFIKGYEEIKLSDFYQPNRNTMGVINEWISLLESRRNMVNPDSVIIKLDKDMQLSKIVVHSIVKYQIKTDNKCNFLGDDENCVYIKQVKSELKEPVINTSNDQLDSSQFRLDKQDSNMSSSQIQFNQEDLEKFSIFNSQRFSDENQKGFQFGKHNKNQIKLLETAQTGFSKEFFSVFKNEYSSTFSKGSKYIAQQIYNTKFEKCNLLEQYFDQSFQNTVSFMINERFTTLLDSIKELPTFQEILFSDFKNEYSVAQPMHYTFDDSKVKYQPDQIKSKEIKNITVTDVYTIQGFDTNETSQFMANLINKDEKSLKDTPQKFKESPAKNFIHNIDVSPISSDYQQQEKQDNQFISSPNVKVLHTQNETKSGQKDQNDDEYEIFNKPESSHDQDQQVKYEEQHLNNQQDQLYNNQDEQYRNQEYLNVEDQQKNNKEDDQDYHYTGQTEHFNIQDKQSNNDQNQYSNEHIENNNIQNNNSNNNNNYNNYNNYNNNNASEQIEDNTYYNDNELLSSNNYENNNKQNDNDKHTRYSDHNTQN